MNAVPGPAGQTTEPATAPARGPAATYALAGVIAVAACVIFLIPLSLVAAARAGSLYFGYGNPARLLLLLAGAVAVAGLVAAVVIAAVASRTPGQQPSTGVAQAPTPTTRRRVVLLGVAAALMVGATLVGVYSGRLAGLFLTFSPSGRATVCSAGWRSFGRRSLPRRIVAAAIVVAAALLPGRATSLRTRTFGVIVIVVLIPSLCLAGLGAWAYYRSWNVATSIAHDQSNYRAQELAREVRSVQRQSGRSARPTAPSSPTRSRRCTPMRIRRVRS